MTFEDYNIYTGNKTGQIKTLCPKCSHTRKNKREPCLSVDTDAGVWNCHNCGWSGSLNKRQYKTFEYEPRVETELVDFFKDRGIEEHSIERFKIGYNQGWVTFPFYKGDEVVNIKGRSADKRFVLKPGGMVIPWNYNDIKEADTLYIFEGEIDCMTAYQAKPSIKCISVPNGANNSWLDKSWGDIDKVENFVLCLDGDEKGEAAKEELANRLGKHRCKFIEYPEGCKDINEVLLAYDQELVKSVLESPSAFPIDGILEFSDYAHEVHDFWENGLPRGYVFGPDQFRNRVSFLPGQLTVFTGSPKSGKSEFIDQMIAWSLGEYPDLKFGMMSFENQPVSFHVTKLVEKISQKTFGKDTISIEEVGRVMDKIDNNIKFYDITNNDVTVDAIINKGKELVGRHGIKFLIIDPYNRMEHKLGTLSQTDYIGEFLNKLNTFQKQYNVHVILVAHPTKVNKMQDGNYEVVKPYDINGSSNWYNKADQILSIWRNFKSNDVELHLTALKWDWTGEMGYDTWFRNPKTKNYECFGQDLPF